MKLNSILSVLFTFTVFHLSKAVPLRLQKRAAFYIANETACVVDNIVYSNGDPIPTDDPCESCKCRPPGFACVLVDCKVKPGCRAVRRVGQCCPEYVCDLPEGNSFFGGNILPSGNLLPVLNDESILPGELPSTQTPETPERPADPTQPPTPSNSAEIATTESKELQDKPQTTVTEISTTEDSKPYVNIEERNDEEEKPSDENKKEDLSEDEGVEKGKPEENSEEIKPLFNSDSEIKKEESVDPTEIRIDPTESSVVELEDQKLKTTVAVIISDDKSEEKVTEISSDEYVSSETPIKEKLIKNSAAENSKSLKLSDDQLKEDPEKKEEIQVDKPEKVEETSNIDTDSKTDAPKEISLVSEESSTAESEPESREIAPEEIQLDPKESDVKSNEKIKSESAETVTAVVHVREKTQATTEKNLPTETILPESATSVTQESLLKSSELKESKSSEESTEAEVVSTAKNFEIFPSSTEVSKDEAINNPPSTDQESEKITKGPELTSEENVSDAKNEESLIAVTTPTDKEDSEISEESRADEEAIDEPTITSPAKIEIITDSLTTTTEEQPAKDFENKEEIQEIKIDDNSEIKEESKQEDKITEIPLEVRESEIETANEKLDETKAEQEKAAEPTPTEPTSTEKAEESISTEKAEKPTSTEEIEVPLITEKAKAETSESIVKSEERAQDTEALATTERVEAVGTEKSKLEDSTTTASQVIKESKQTNKPSDTE